MARIKAKLGGLDGFDPYEGVGFDIGFGYGQIEQASPPGGGFRSDLSVGDPTTISRPRAVFPSVHVLTSSAPTGYGHPPPVGPEAVSPADVIDPDFRPTATVYEDAPGGIYETNRAPTDWGAFYDAYVILNPPEEDVAFHGSIDWGEAVGTILGGVLDPLGIGDAARLAFAPRTTVTGIPSLGQQTVLAAPGVTTMATTGCPPLGPKYAKICLATNEITPLRRRRRRRLLTSSDIKDLAALKAIVGGAALQGAVVQAIRR